MSAWQEIFCLDIILIDCLNGIHFHRNRQMLSTLFLSADMFETYISELAIFE